MVSFADFLQQVEEAADPAPAYVGMLVTLQLSGFVPSDTELTQLHEVARKYNMTHELLQVRWQNSLLESCRLC
jgi:hypothetical protein